MRASAAIAVFLTRVWTRVYVAGLPRRIQQARIDEIESDLWGSLHDRDSAYPHIGERLARGMSADIRWRAAQNGEQSHVVWLSLAAAGLLTLSLWQALAGSAVSRFVRESVWMYPATESLHVVSVVVVVGTTVLFDFRLLGVMLRPVHVSTLLSYTLPWTTGAAFFAIVSGALLFVADVGQFAPNRFFQTKATALVLAGINAAVFHGVSYSRIEEWDDASPTPVSARAAAVVSLSLWTVVIVSSHLVPFASTE